MTDAMGSTGQTQRMQAALSPVLVLGPEFLAGRCDADGMAHTMVRAVQEYANAERQRSATQSDDVSAHVSTDHASQELQAVLAEVYTCGSGYLANRCDSDCVVRTMTQIVREFGDLASTH